jgi:hypothetical protein
MIFFFFFSQEAKGPLPPTGSSLPLQAPPSPQRAVARKFKWTWEHERRALLWGVLNMFFRNRAPIGGETAYLEIAEYFQVDFFLYCTRVRVLSWTRVRIGE